MNIFAFVLILIYCTNELFAVFNEEMSKISREGKVVFEHYPRNTKLRIFCIKGRCVETDWNKRFKVLN